MNRQQQAPKQTLLTDYEEELRTAALAWKAGELSTVSAATALNVRTDPDILNDIRRLGD